MPQGWGGQALYGLYIRHMKIATTEAFDPWEDLNPVHQQAWGAMAKDLQKNLVKL